MNTSIKLNIHFAPGKCGHRMVCRGRKPSHMKPERLPRITRLMALAIKYEHMLAKGWVESHGEIARLAGVDRSQISAILRLRLLAPDIQEWLINLPETAKSKGPLGQMKIYAVAAIPSWEEQRERLHSLIPDHYPIYCAEGAGIADGASPLKPKGEIQ